MTKEMGIGGVVGILIFMFFLGYNVTPVILIAAMGAAFYFLIVKKGGLVKSKFETLKKVDVAFEDIGGQKNAIIELKEALDFINKSKKISQLGIRPLKGILLTGPPGTGKTLMAKAAVTYTDSVYLAASGSEFVEMYAGVGAQRVRQIFKEAVNKAKKTNKSSAIIFIDEIEVLGVKRGSHSSHMEYDQTLNQLLVEMDGIKANNDIKILLIAATNRPDMLDAALLRPGRFDRQVKVELPDKDGRLHILKLHTKNKPLKPDVCLEKVAQETFGFSGADLENLANEAAIMTFRQGKTSIEQSAFIEAIDKVLIGERANRKLNSDELNRIAVHETGHALISELVKPHSVSHLTIVSRGNALGYMRQKPDQDRYLYTRDYMEKQIKICLGGALAEQVILGDRSSGAQNDFKQATELAKRIIYGGMSSLGIVSVEELGKEDLRKEIEKILTNLEGKVLEEIHTHANSILSIKNYLIEHETISGEQFRLKMSDDSQREIAN